MDIKVFRSPTGQEQNYPRVERMGDERRQQKKKDDEQKDKKKKNNQQMENLFSNLAESLSFGTEV